MLSLRTLFHCAGVAFLAVGCRTLDPASRNTAAFERPSLVVIVAVDQLRPDMVDRYQDAFEGGFRRLMDEGYRFSDTTHDHAETNTAPGHVSLATGVYPSRHGVVDNNWSSLVQGDWVNVYCVEDPESQIVGFPDMPGRSPANLFRGGLPDWILAADPNARVVSLSMKDRGAIGLAGKAKGEVYWLPPSEDRFVTSDFYRSDYPAWIARFNEEVMPQIYSKTVWESRTPEQYLPLARPDTSNYELDGVHTFFPHRASDRVDPAEPGRVNTWRSNETPYPDDAVLALARAAIRELELGQRGPLDYLGISFSQTDLIGHRFGPFSREQLDNLIRLDEALGELFATLDTEVGRDRWVLAFSSDHGVQEIPEHLAERGGSARRLSREDRLALREAMEGAVASGEEGDALAERMRAGVTALPFVADAYTFAELEDPEAVSDSFAVMFSRSHSRERVLDLSARYGVRVRYEPDILTGGNRASHGTPYLHDRAVPLFFLGVGVAPGISTTRASTVDVAPTLARLAGIEAPDDLDGRPLF